MDWWLFQYSYAGSVLAFLSPSFPQSNISPLICKQFSGFPGFPSIHSRYWVYSLGHYFLKIRILGAVSSSLGNLASCKALRYSFRFQQGASLLCDREHVRTALHWLSIKNKSITHCPSIITDYQQYSLTINYEQMFVFGKWRKLKSGKKVRFEPKWF